MPAELLDLPTAPLSPTVRAYGRFKDIQAGKLIDITNMIVYLGESSGEYSAYPRLRKAGHVLAFVLFRSSNWNVYIVSLTSLFQALRAQC